MSIEKFIEMNHNLLFHFHPFQRGEVYYPKTRDNIRQMSQINQALTMYHLNDKNYSAHAFHPSLPKGSSSGILRFTNVGIRFSTGEREVVIPYTAASFYLGGAGKRLVFIAHPSLPEWSIYTNDLSIVKNPVLSSNVEIAKQLARIRRGRLFNWSVLVGVLALFVVIPVLLLASMDSITAIVARQVPVTWEEDIGKNSFAQYHIEHELMSGKAAEQSLKALTSVLTEHKTSRKYTFHIYVTNDPALNAFALPGGYIVLNAGLVLAADSAEELLGVLAHEMVHVTQQHGIRNIIGSIGIYLIVQALLGDTTGLLAAIAEAAPLLINQKYSRHFEAEADRLGFELLSQANVDPRGMVHFFEKVLAEQQKLLAKMEKEGGDIASVLTATLGYLSSHPATEQRIVEINAMISSKTAADRELAVEFEQLQTLVRRFVSESEINGGN